MVTLADAIDYLERDWSVIPIRMADKRPSCKWKPYQTRRPDRSEVREWFRGHEEHGIAVIFGRISSGLASRDFDELTAYHRWAMSRPELARTLPTVVTRRGRHVYFAAADEQVAEIRADLGKPDGTGAIQCVDGELRVGLGCYSVLPPSRHPQGTTYYWVNPLPPGPLPLVDLRSANFADLPCNREHREAQSQQSNMASVVSADSAVSVHLCCTEVASPPSEAMEAAIMDSLPTKPGQRNHQVFQLARALKAIPGLEEATARDLKPWVRQWHQLAKPVIATQPFEETWIDFLRAWPRVKFPKGTDLLVDVFQAAVAAEVPEVALQFEQPELRLLVALCRELHRRSHGSPFFLSCRAAGQLLSVDHTTASRWLFLLAAEDILEVVKKGGHTSRKASRYRYIADQ